MMLLPPSHSLSTFNTKPFTLKERDVNCCFSIHSDSQIFDNIALNREFYDEKWSKNRVVTSLDWSTQVLVHFLNLICNLYNVATFDNW